MAQSELAHAPRSRRAILAAAAGGAAALAATAIRPVGVAAAPATMMTETDNVAEAPTSLTNNSAGQKALIVRASGDGRAIEAVSSEGPGMFAVSANATDPATNTKNAGVVGVSGNSEVIASNIALTGVYGYSDPSPSEGFVGAGVWGDSPDFGVIGTGVVGSYGEGFVGAFGYTETANGVGVEAVGAAPSSLALYVGGRAEFTRSGRATVNAGKAKKTVTLAGCTSSTLVIAVLAANRSGRWVRAVVPASGSFAIYLNTKVSSATSVSWIAFTNPSNHSG